MIWSKIISLVRICFTATQAGFFSHQRDWKHTLNFLLLIVCALSANRFGRSKVTTMAAKTVGLVYAGAFCVTEVSLTRLTACNFLYSCSIHVFVLICLRSSFISNHIMAHLESPSVRTKMIIWGHAVAAESYCNTFSQSRLDYRPWNSLYTWKWSLWTHTMFFYLLIRFSAFVLLGCRMFASETWSTLYF